MALPLLQMMESASAEEWSGNLQVYGAAGSCGSVSFNQGLVVRAVSRDQTETLGALLVRLGIITKSQLNMARNLFKAHEGRMPLGVIIMECRFVNRMALRKGIMLHTRQTLAALAAVEEHQVRPVPGDLRLHEDFMFKVEEVLPSAETPLPVPCDDPDLAAWRFWKTRTTENSVLLSLTQLEHYQASGVFTVEGGIVTAHLSEDVVDPHLLGKMVAGARQAVETSTNEASLGTLRTILFHHDAALVISRVLGFGPDLHCLVLVVAPTANVGWALRVLDGSSSEITTWLADNSSPERFMALLRSLLRDADGDSEAAPAVAMAVKERVRRAREQHLGNGLVERYRRALAHLERRRVGEAVTVLEGIEAQL